MRALADDRSIVIKEAHKDSTIAICGGNDYIPEAEK